MGDYKSCPGCGSPSSVGGAVGERVDVFLEPVVSSNIKAIGYSDCAKKLVVEFVGGGCYEYLGIEREVYVALIESPSKGKYFHSNIRGIYECLKI